MTREHRNQHKFLFKVNSGRLFYFDQLNPYVQNLQSCIFHPVDCFPDGMFTRKKKVDERAALADAIENSIKTELLNKWYPAAMDKEYGGFLSTWTYDFKPTGEQDKMIVSQARHVWSSSKASEAYTDVPHYRECAAHGFRFLKDVMWDKTYGGFHQLVDRQGNVKKWSQ